MVRRTSYRYLLSLALWLTIWAYAVAQRPGPYSEVGLAAGGMNYLGDLNGQSMLGKVNVAGGALYRRNIDRRWAFAIGAAYGNVEGGNPDVQAWRNLSFRSHIIEGTLRVEFNFVSLGFGATDYRTTPYIFGGLGLFAFNPQGQYIDSTGSARWVDLEPLGTEGQHSDLYPETYPYNLVGICMPFGLGFKAKISKSVVVAIEYGFRKTWTDYIDDVSTLYVDPVAFEGNAVAAAMADRSGEVAGRSANPVGTQRGDDSLDDWYSFFNISVSINTDFLFGWARSKRCYTDE